MSSVNEELYLLSVCLLLYSTPLSFLFWFMISRIASHDNGIDEQSCIQQQMHVDAMCPLLLCLQLNAICTATRHIWFHHHFVATPTTRLIFYTAIPTKFKSFYLPGPWPWVFRLSLPLQYDNPNTVHYILARGAFNKIGSHVTVTPNNLSDFGAKNKPNI